MSLRGGHADGRSAVKVQDCRGGREMLIRWMAMYRVDIVVEGCRGPCRDGAGRGWNGAGRPCSARQSKIHPKACSRGRAVMVNREGVSQ